MRNKTKSLQCLPLAPPFFPGLTSLLIFYLLLLSGAEDGEWGLQSVHHTLSLPLIPPQGDDSSHASPTPA